MREQKKPMDATNLHEHRHDPGEWSAKPVRVDVRLAKTSVVSCRLPTAELEELVEAAERAGETVSDYIRGAVTLRRELTAFGVRIPGIAAFGIQFSFPGTELSGRKIVAKEFNFKVEPMQSVA